MPTAVEGRRRLQPEERKRLLLDQAVSVFADRGIGRGGHTEIAEISGVSVATVFNYFNTREDLVNCVLHKVELELISISKAAYQQAATPLEAIVEHIKAFLGLCQEKPEYMKVWLEWSSSVRDEVRPQYLKFQDQLLTLISEHIDNAISQGILATGLAAEERALWLLGNLQMLVTMSFDTSSDKDLESLIDRGIKHILDVK